MKSIMKGTVLKNPATKPSSEMNDFTNYVIKNKGCFVRVRCGFWVRPEFEAAEDDTCSDGFVTDCGNYRWNMDGTSVTGRDYDMMEVEKSS